MKKLTSLAAALLCTVLLTSIMSCANAADSSAPAASNEGNNQPENQGPVKYKVNIAASIEHGSVTADPTSATAGTEITLTATADQGYLFSSYSVTGAGGAAITVSEQGKFTMPESDVTVSVSFIAGAWADLSNFNNVISSLTQDSTILMTGQLTSGDLSSIKSILKTSQHKIKLDLSGVTGLDSLPQGAFDGNSMLQSLSLPEGLASIGEKAFSDCVNLESLYLPASFSSFKLNAFEISPNPNVFVSINVAKGNPTYSSVDGVLFSRDKKTLVKCPQGKSGAYTVPAGVTTIGQNAFDGCRKITGIVLPNSLQEICTNAFKSTVIESMIIPSSVISISVGILYGNESLKTLFFEDATGWYSTLNNEEFITKTGGQKVDFSDDGESNKSIYNNDSNYYKAFFLCTNVEDFKQSVAALKQDTTFCLFCQIDQTSLSEISGAIKKASYMIKLDMSGATGISSLPERAFEDCDKLQEIIFPEGLVSIGNSAFDWCKNLKSIYLPSSFNSFEAFAFMIYNSTVFSSINVAEGNPTYSSVDGVLFSKDKKILVKCPPGKSGAFTIPDGCEKIGDSAFLWARIESLVIPDSVTVMEPNALCACSSLTSLRLSANLTKIEDNALSGINVKSLELPNSVTSIGFNAFNGCEQLESIVIPNTVTSIGNSAFQYCSKLKRLVIPASVTSLGSYFAYSSSFTYIEFEDPSGWKYTTNNLNWENRTGGTSVDLSNPETNASKLKSSKNGDWVSYYWYKSTQN